jgi:tRNA A-37 threonylcarbamoyl transferase component Bud32
VSLVFGKYEKIRRVAQGGMGEVFLARQTGVLDRLVILKALRHELVLERDFVEQFLDEARVAATLNHPNIVSLYDVGEWEGTYYIAMEYVAGEDLSRIWYAAAKAGVGLPFHVSVRICMEAALALEHAHGAKDVHGRALSIVHRDVSPQNVMVRMDGVTKLVDFGIAKAANKSSRTQRGMVKGKLQYMSPEQVRGDDLDGRSDQFSLGVVLWEMCTGRRLFKADTDINTVQKILNLPIPRPQQYVPGFPTELEGVILRLLEREREARYPSLKQAVVEMRAYLDRGAGTETVADFVQRIVGAEVEQRTRDITPTANLEAASLPPAATPPPASVQRPLPASLTPSPVVVPAVPARASVLPTRHDLKSTTTQAEIDAGPSLEDAVSAGHGAFGAQATAQMSAPDTLRLVAASRKPAIAQAPTEVVERGALRASPTAPQAEVSAMVARPDVAADDGPFSLGTLPQGKTGTWGAPEIAQAMHKPDAIDDSVLPALTPRRVPALLWAAVGLVAAMFISVGLLWAFKPAWWSALVGAPVIATTTPTVPTPATPTPTPVVAPTPVTPTPIEAAVPTPAPTPVEAPVVETHPADKPIVETDKPVADKPAPVPESYDSAAQKADRALRAGRGSEALRWWKMALELRPNDIRAELGVGNASLMSGKSDAALRTFQAVLAKQANRIEAQLGVADALRAQGRTSDAVVAYERYLELSPSGRDADRARDAVRALQ